MRIVGGITTLPERYSNLEKTMQTINNQTVKLDALYFGKPKYCKRLNIEYPELPEYIKNTCTVIECEDHGPITKIYAPLLMENDPDTIIITFDDDVLYDPSLVEKLIKCHLKKPNCAISCGGLLFGNNSNPTICSRHNNNTSCNWDLISFDIKNEYRKVDSIMGSPGALYIRKFFPPTKYIFKDFIKPSISTKCLFLNDDIAISGYLSKNNIDRLIFKDIPRMAPVAKNTTNSLSYNGIECLKSMNTAINDAKQLGYFNVLEKVTYQDSPIYKPSTITILIIFVFLLYLITLYFSKI